MSMQGQHTVWTPTKWAFALSVIAALWGVYAYGVDLDWQVLAMVLLAASAGGLSAELRGRGGRVQIALEHPVLFACAITLGPFGALIPAAAVGVRRVFSRGQPCSPLYLLMCDLLGPPAATAAASFTFISFGGNIDWPQGADSLGAALLAALAYASVGAIVFGVSRQAAVAVIEPPKSFAVTAGWLLSLLTGYLLAVIYCTAPVYAFYAASIAGFCAACALAIAPTQRRGVREAEASEETHQSADSPTYVDPATGLASRRYLDLFLDREIGRSHRLGKPLSLAVFNIDGFRHLDHEAGRRTMLELGECLAAGVREYDIAARHSDGRLVVVLPETPTAAALDVVDRLRRSATAVMGQSISISVGLAAFPDHGVTSQDIINAAHHALNRGRSQTSDCVHLPEDLQKAS